MVQSSSRIPRPRITSGAVAQALRERIVEGGWQPGEKLPRRVDLEAEFATSTATVQRALDELSRDGFVVAKRRVGTFVAEDPPHRTRIGVVFRGGPGDSRMWFALDHEIRRLEREGLAIKPYYGVHGDQTPEATAALVDDIEGHRLAGLIFANPPEHFEGTTVLEASWLARVILMPWRRDLSIPHVKLDSTLDKLLDHARQQGRERVAVVSSCFRRDTRANWHAKVEEYGLKTRDCWLIHAHPGAPSTAWAAVRLLMESADRPELLAIDDDHLIETTTRALHESGVSVPDELEVVAHCNFPWPSPSSVPVTRLGYDIPAMLDAAITLLKNQVRSEGPTDPVVLPAVFEHEVSRTTRQVGPSPMERMPSNTAFEPIAIGQD